MDPASRRRLLGIAAAALCVRILFVAGFARDTVHNDDGWRYLNVARNLRDGRGFSLTPDERLHALRPLLRDRLADPYSAYPTAFVPPGYPVFLAALIGDADPGSPNIGAALLRVKFVQILLDLVTVVSLFVIGRALFSDMVGLWSALGWALYPYAVFFACDIGTETLFTAGMTAAAALLAVSPRLGPVAAASSGAILGAVCMVRQTPVMLGFVLLLLIWRLPFNRREDRRRAIAGFAVLFLILPALWMGRNSHVLGRPLLSTQPWVTLWLGNNYYSDRYLDGRVQGLHYVTFSPVIIREIRHKTEPEMADVFRRQVLQFVTDDPRRWMRVLAVKAFEFWRPYVYAEYYSPLYRAVALGSTIPLYILSTWGIILSWRRRRSAVVALTVPMLYGWLLHTVFHPLIRFRVTFADVFLLVFAAVALSSIRIGAGPGEAECGNP